MSYTLRGRIESRLAALAPPVLVAAGVHEWWAIELAGLMVAVALAFDLLYHAPIAYQPGWAAVPLGLLELGVVMALVRALGVHAPLRWALVFYAGAWLWSQLLAHALLPRLRWTWSEDGGELGARVTTLAAAALTLPSPARAASTCTTCRRPFIFRRACTRGRSTSTGGNGWSAIPARSCAAASSSVTAT